MIKWKKKFDSEIMVCQMYIPWLIMLKALCHYKAKVELLNIAMGFVGGMWLTTTKSLLAHTADWTAHSCGGIANYNSLENS